MEKQANTNLAQYVHGYIMEMLIKQELKSGEKVPEEKIADILKVSRTPIREALRILAAEGLVELYPKRFAKIVTFTEEDIQDLGMARLSQDLLAGKLAIFNGSNADFMALAQIAEQCNEYALKGDMYNRIVTDVQFHLKLSEIGGNPILTKFQYELYQKVCLLQAIGYSGVEDSVSKISHHQKIIEGLVDRDEEKLLRATREHLIKFYHLESSKYKFFLEKEIF